MKILLNLTSTKVSFEYMETTPFIQGVDTRNAIYVYREYEATPALTNLSISYQVQSGRYTLPIGNTSAQPETIGGVLYNRWKFNVPLAATAIAGNIMACLVVVTATGHYKLNILNNVLNSSEFDAFQSGLEGAAETYGQVMESYNSAQTIQDQRITAVENASGVDNTKIEQLQNTVYGSTSGQTSAGLVSKVAAIETEIGSDATANSIKGRITANETAIENIESDVSGIETEIGTNNTSGTIKGRITAIENADYQSQIDAINAAQNLADIVANLTALNSLDTSNLRAGDKVQVLVDSNHSNASTVYNWTGSAWSYIGNYGQDGYTKSQEDLLLAAKENKSNKITSWGTPTDTQYPSAKLVKDNLDVLATEKANADDVYTKNQVYTTTQVDDIIDTLVADGYEMPYSRMVAIFNDAYSNDPVVTALNTLNGEVV